MVILVGRGRKFRDLEQGISVVFPWTRLKLETGNLTNTVW